MEADVYQEQIQVLAFYVWTDTLILNAVKTKLNHFSDLLADLFILKLSRISWNLVHNLEKQQVFRNIIWIEPPFKDMVSIKRRFLKIFSYQQYKKNYFIQLKEITDSYTALFSGALWSETIMLFQYLKQYNSSIEICIIEEGTANYYGFKAILKCDPLNELRNKIIQKIRYSNIYEEVIYAVKKMFLACPEGCLDYVEKPIYPIGEYRLSKFYQLISNCVKNLSLEVYRSRRIIFFLQPEHLLDYKKTLILLRIIILIAHPENIIIRPHPDTMGKVNHLKKFLDPQIYWETERFPFEYVLYTARWETQILISRGSSCLFYPRYILGEEPIVIFTNQLYGGIKKKREKMSLLVEKLNALYHNSERVFQPKKIEEFKNILRRKLLS